MKVDKETLGALKNVVRKLDEEPHHPVPVGVIDTLRKIAKPGTRVHLDLEASKIIGAPLVTVQSNAKTTDLLNPLTNRQRQVAALIIEGLPNRIIASQLGISLATVKDHVHAILDRLNLPSRAALIAASRS